MVEVVDVVDVVDVEIGVEVDVAKDRAPAQAPEDVSTTGVTVAGAATMTTPLIREMA